MSRSQRRRDRPLHNLFFALRPTLAAAAQVSDVKTRLLRESGVIGRTMRSDCLQIPLRSLGVHDEPPDRLVAKAVDPAAKVVMPPFVVALNCVLGWKGPSGRQPLVLTGDDGAIGIDC